MFVLSDVYLILSLCSYERKCVKVMPKSVKKKGGGEKKYVALSGLFSYKKVFMKISRIVLVQKHTKEFEYPYGRNFLSLSFNAFRLH